MKVAVVGAGWAGMAAAVEAAGLGMDVTVFEATRTLGGRARALPADKPDGSPLTLDNGQHILIGAYSETLALMQRVGLDLPQVLMALPVERCSKPLTPRSPANAVLMLKAPLDVARPIGGAGRSGREVSRVSWQPELARGAGKPAVGGPRAS